jgi:DNA-binding transcriptional ArsR family regulator
VLREAGLIEAEKEGRVIFYRLRMSVVEEALLGFARALGIEPAARRKARSKRSRRALRRREA